MDFFYLSRYCALLVLLLCLPRLGLSQTPPVQNLNYVTSNRVTVPGIVTAASVLALTPAERQQQVVYYEGLGRPVQQVRTQSSPSGLDQITPIVYDALGRTPLNYLPYTRRGTSGSFRPDALSRQLQFYQASYDAVADDNAPWTRTVFEPSPLNRVLEQGSVGTAWQPNAAATCAATIKTTTKANAENEVRDLVFDADTHTVMSRRNGHSGVDLNGASADLLVNSPSLLDLVGSNTMTLEAWVFPTSNATDGVILSMGAEYGLARLASTGEIYCHMGNFPTGWRNTYIQAPLQVWTHIAITFSYEPNGSLNITYYQNGIMQSTAGGYGSVGCPSVGSSTSSCLTPTQISQFEFRIGSQQAPLNGSYFNSGTNNFAGMVSEVMVWQTERSDLEIGADMLAYASGASLTNAAGLLAYWPLNESGSTTYGTNSTSPSRNWAILRNGAVWRTTPQLFYLAGLSDRAKSH